MAKIKLTRPELKRQRDALKRFQRFLPMLKLRQSQLQSQLNSTAERLAEARQALAGEEQRCDRFAPVLRDPAGVDLQHLIEPVTIHTRTIDIAGISAEEFEGIDFPAANYGLLETPAWLDMALEALRERRRQRETVRLLEEEHRRIAYELRKTIQRVNLFEQVKIPESREAIRKIRIRLGDEMTNAIGRGKIAKSKLADLVVIEAAADIGDEA